MGSALLELPNEVWINIIRRLNVADVVNFRQFKPALFNIVTDKSPPRYFKKNFNDGPTLKTRKLGNTLFNEDALHGGGIILVEISDLSRFFERENVARFIRAYSSKIYYICFWVTTFTHYNMGAIQEFRSGYPLLQYMDIPLFTVWDTSPREPGAASGMGFGKVRDLDGEGDIEVLEKLRGIFFKAPFVSCAFPSVTSLELNSLNDWQKSNDVYDPVRLFQFNDLSMLSLYTHSHDESDYSRAINTPLTNIILHTLLNVDTLRSLALSIYPGPLTNLNFPNLKRLRLKLFHSGEKPKLAIKDVSAPRLKFLEVEYFCESSTAYEEQNFYHPKLEFLRIEDSRLEEQGDFLREKGSIEEFLIESILKEGTVQQADLLVQTLPSTYLHYRGLNSLKHIYITQSLESGFEAITSDDRIEFGELETFGIQLTRTTSLPFDYFIAPNLTTLYLNFDDIRHSPTPYLKSVPACFPNVKEICFTGWVYSESSSSLISSVAFPSVETIRAGHENVRTTLFNLRSFFKGLSFPNAAKMIIFDGSDFPEKVYLDLLIDAPLLRELIFEISPTDIEHSEPLASIIIHKQGLNSLERVLVDSEIFVRELVLVGFEEGDLHDQLTEDTIGIVGKIRTISEEEYNDFIFEKGISTPYNSESVQILASTGDGLFEDLRSLFNST